MTDIRIVQGQRLTLFIPISGLQTVGRGLRMHIRDTPGAPGVRAVLTHDGATNTRVAFTTGGVLITLGATISTAWALGVGTKSVSWVHSIESYSTTDADDVDVIDAGAVLVVANPTDEQSITAVPALPSFVHSAVLFDRPQSLTTEQKAQFRENAGLTGGGDVVGPASATDSHVAAFDGTTGKLIKGGGYTVAGLLAAARDRATHTGTQLAATISDFASAVGALLTWSSISDKPSTFPPSSHSHSGLTPQAQEAWEEGISTSESVISPEKLAAAFVAFGGGGATSPAGSSGQPQYNNGGAFGAMTGVTWDSANSRIGFGTASPAAVVHAVADSTTEPGIISQLAASATANGYEMRNSAGSAIWYVTPDGFIRTPTIAGAANVALQLGAANTGLGNFGGSILIVLGGTPYVTIASTGTVFVSLLEVSGQCLKAYRHVVEPRTSGTSVAWQESSKRFTNTGASGEITLTLPDVYDGDASFLGQHFEGIVTAAQYLRFTAPTGETITTTAGTVSASGGYIRSNAVGSKVTLTKVAANAWHAETHGTWTVDS